MKMVDFTGTGKLVRLIVKRDWPLLLAWALILAVLALFVAVGLAKLYTTPEMVAEFAAGVNNSPGEVALLGRVLSPTLGGIIAWRLAMPAYIIGGLISLLAVIRYTRTEEEAGRLELVSSAVVGKHAGLSAALIVAFAANLAIAVLTTLVLLAFRLPFAGSLAIALAIASAGCVLAGVAAVAAQVAGGTGTARGIAGCILVLAFIVRVIADGINDSWLSWLTPVGWMQQAHAFAGEQWWVFLLFIGLTAVLAAAAFALSSRRDLGAGMLPQRPGPASGGLRSSLALAWRLQRSMLFAWIAACIFAGTVLGYLGKTIMDQLFANPRFMEYIARLGGNATPADGFFTMILMIVGEVVTVYAIMATLKLQSEENEMHAEAVLATPVSRLKWVSGHLAIAIIGTAAILLTFGLAAGLTYGLSAGSVGQEVPRMLAAAIAYLPAICILAGIAMALYGLLPRFTLASWGAFFVCLLIELVAEFRLAGGVILDVSPFTHVPKLLISDASVLPLGILLAIAAMLIVGGLVGLQRRSIS